MQVPLTQGPLTQVQEPSFLAPLGHWLQFNPSASVTELAADGHPRLGGFMPPVPKSMATPRRMWAGSKIEYEQQIELGMPITKQTTIESVTPKHGSSGELLFVRLRHEIYGENISPDNLALREWQTIVYRNAVSKPQGDPQSKKSETETPEWPWRQKFVPDEITLFRYSALTFNSHRIHYDHKYVTEVEGYPGLVVHGPLTASLALQLFLRQSPEAKLRSFEFQARSPLFVGNEITVTGRPASETEAEVNVLDQTGKVSVRATVQTH